MQDLGGNVREGDAQSNGETRSPSPACVHYFLFSLSRGPYRCETVVGCQVLPSGRALCVCGGGFFPLCFFLFLFGQSCFSLDLVLAKANFVGGLPPLSLFLLKSIVLFAGFWTPLVHALDDVAMSWTFLAN